MHRLECLGDYNRVDVRDKRYAGKLEGAETLA